MSDSLEARATESRIPAIIAVLIVAGLVTLLPSHYQPSTPWIAHSMFGLIIASMIAVSIAPSKVWQRIERVVVLALVVIVGAMNVAAVGRLVADMVTHKHDYTGLTLLESAVVIWTLNVLIFALLYWQLDRAGPEARAAGVTGAEDFRFADAHEGDAPGRRPGFVDYLFLAFSASTTFTAPDYMRPVSARAKLIIMLQAAVSLTTLFLIASRAITMLS